MKMTYQGHPGMDIKQPGITVLGTNNAVVYRNIIYGMNGWNEQVRFCSDQYERLEVKKALWWLGGVTDVRVNLKKALPKLLTRITKQLGDEQSRTINHQLQGLNAELQKLLFMYDIQLDTNLDNNFLNLLKFYHVDLDPIVYDSAYGIIETSLKINQECNINTCLGFSNLANYLTPDQIQDLQELTISMGISLVLIEFTEMSCQDAYKNCDFYYIDEDFVDWFF